MERIRQLHYRQVARPLRMLFRTALGSKSTATSVLVHVVLDGGAAGLGEVPTSFVAPHETPAAIKEVLRACVRALRGSAIEGYGEPLAELRRRFGRFRMTLAALEVALFRADLAARGESEWAWWGGQARRIETDITIPFLTGRDELARWIGHAAGVGFRQYKVKVSGDVEADLAFVKAVVGLLGAGGRDLPIRLDGNQGYTAGSYRRMVDGLGRAGIAIELFEQPLRADDHAGLRRIRGHGGIPVVLDETIFDADDCRRAIAEGLGDGVNIKIAKSGIAGSREIIRQARAAGLKLMVGCMTETMAGLSAGIRMAAGAGAFDYVDLDAAHLLFSRRRYDDIRIEGRSYLIQPRGSRA